MKKQNKIIFSFLVSIILFLGFSFSNTYAATLYFNNNTGDGTWDTSENWWSDVSMQTPAGSIPSNGDAVYIAADICTGPSQTVNLDHVYVADESTGGGNFTVNLSNAVSDVTFNNGSYNYYGSAITGNVTFTGSSYPFNPISQDFFYGGSVTGSVTFTADNVTFTIGDGQYWNMDTSSWIFTGVGTPTWIFNGGTLNSTTINGNAIFNFGSYSYSSKVDGNATFTGTSYSNDPTGVDMQVNGSGVTGTVTFTGDNVTFSVSNFVWQTEASSWIFTGEGTPTWTFESGSDLNYGTIHGNAVFKAGSIFSYGTVVGDVTFYGSSQNGNRIEGSAIFNGSSYLNDPTRDPNVGSSAGITGTVTFTGNNVTFTLESEHTWDSDTSSWIFTGSGAPLLINESSINGGTFFIPIRNDNTIEGGIFHGSITNNNYIYNGSFYSLVTNNGTIYGGSFCQSQAETGGSIEDYNGVTFGISNPLCYNTPTSIIVNSPTNLSVLSSWSPSISFTGSPTTCKYKMDSDDYVTLDCNSMSIPTPTEWPHLLTVTAESPYGGSTSTISFIFSTLLGNFTGSLSPIALPAPTHHTLGDIYNVIVEGTPSETNDHTLSTTTTPTATTTHSTSEIYARLANLIDASTIKSGVTYLGVTGGGETPEPIEIIPTSLTPLLTPNDRTGFSLEDIYQLVKNNVRVTSSTHDITNSSTVGLTQHSIEDIYRTLTALIQPGNVLLGESYLGVEGAYDPRPIAQWKMNDNAGSTTVLDSSGNGLDGTAIQNTSVIHATGVVGGALSFDGVSDTVSINNFTMDADWSIDGWIKPTINQVGAIISQSTDSNNNAVIFLQGANNGELTFYVNSEGNNVVNVASAGGFNLNEWKHFVLAYDGIDYHFYINGVEGTTVYNNAQSWGSYSGNLVLGHRDMDDSYYFGGLMDDVRVYNRALSQEEISALYNSGNGTEN
jgi:hypothetical protein